MPCSQAAQSRAFRSARITAWLPDLDAFEAWDEIAIFWVCYPNNPTGAVAPLSFYEELAARAREHGFIVCSDEAYSELWFDTPPCSALQVSDRTNVVVFNTLSKRSSMTGYRSRVRVRAAGDRRRAAQLPPVDRHRAAGVRAARLGRSPGRTTPTSRTCARCTGASARPCCLHSKPPGLRLAGSTATFYLWLDVGGPSEAFARRLLEHGVVCAPGSFFGPAGDGYVRFALVPTQEQCERAAEIVRRCWRRRLDGVAQERGAGFAGAERE